MSSAETTTTTTPPPPPSHHALILDKLVVSMCQPDTSPSSVNITVSNTHHSPVTILTYDSPLDPIALSLGLISIWLPSSPSPLALNTISVRRVMPPPEDAFVTVPPGGSSSNYVALDSVLEFLPEGVLDLAGARLLCTGRWMSVWEGSRGQLDDELGGDGLPDPSAMTGSFRSNEIVLA